MNLRLYWPSLKLDGTWTPQLIRRSEKAMASLDAVATSVSNEKLIPEEGSPPGFGIV
jgi:hypothetical protein